MNRISAAARGLPHLSAGVGLVFCLLATGCSPPLDWREVHLRDADGLKTMFPCKPKATERRVPWPGLPGGVDMRLLSCETEGGTWALSFVRLPDVALVAPAMHELTMMTRRNLAAAAQLAGAGPSVHEQDLGPVAVPHMTPSPQAHAWRFEAQRPDGLGRPLDMDIRSWHFSHGLTVFQASVWRPRDVVKAQSGEDVAEPFFRGLEFPG